MRLNDAEFEEQSRLNMQRLFDVSDRIDADDAGLRIEHWRALEERERIKLWEHSQDSKYARDQHLTLNDYRAQWRGNFEAGNYFRPECGQPQWLRDAYARERPAEVAVEYLELITQGEIATGNRLLELIGKIDARTGRGFVGMGDSFAAAKERLLAEIARAGLTDYFEEVQRQQRERAN
jgi:hypothetical protein